MPRQYRKYDLSDYTVTQNGDVINNHNGHVLKPQPNGKGYLRIGVGGKLLFVHRLVAEKYVPNPENKPQVNHKDGNKLNNNADNLEWVTNKENRSHAVKNKLHLCGEDCPWAKLTKEQVEFIRKHSEIPAKELADTFGVVASTIRDIRRHQIWKD